MIFTDRTIIVQKGTSSINDTIILYRGDKNVEVRFTLNEGSPFKFGSGASPNIIEKTEASYGQLIIKTSNDLPTIFSKVAPTNEGKIIFEITGEMIDEIVEVGYYTFQIRLFDENRNSRATLPEVVNGIEIREPIATEVTDTNEAGIATVGYALTTVAANEDAFDAQGNYNKTTWETGDRITASKLNKMEAGIDEVNKKVASGGTGSNNAGDISIADTAGNFTANTVEGALAELFQSVSSGKSLIASAITDMGVTTLATASFEEMASNIRQLKVSKNFATMLSLITEWEVIGDSITDEGILPLTKYVTVLKNEYTNITTVNNCAKSGAHITNKTTGYKTFSTLVDEGLSNASTNAGLVTIFGGVNDYLQNCNIGTINDETNTTFYGACKELIYKVKNKFTQAEIIWIIPLNIRDGEFGSNENGINNAGSTLDDYRVAIKNVCAMNNIKIIDVHEDSELQPDTLSNDGLHPTQDGHVLLASKFKSYIPYVPSSSSSGGSSGGGEDIKTYDIIYNLTNCTTNNTNTSITEGNSYSCTITADNGYDIDNINVTMGGSNITASAVNGNVITVSNVTGDIVITASATQTASGGETGTYTTAVTDNFSTVGNCSGIDIDSSGNLTASTLSQWGMVKLDKTVTKLKFTVRSNQADYGALCWYIYNNNDDGTYNMIALGNIFGGENGKRFKMTIPGAGATQIDKLDISTINPGETLTIEISSGTQTIKREDGTTLTTLTGNMSGWCGQSTNSSPFCSNVQYVEQA